MPKLACCLALMLVAPGAELAFAQAGGSPQQALTVRQVQQRFRHMSSVHVLKCDYNGDELIEAGAEFQCVQSIYRVMYQGRN